MYTRENPSPRFRELVAAYRRMHVEGEQHLQLAPRRTFPGRSLLAHAGVIRRLLREHGAQTLLDYGAGKGLQYRLRDFQLPSGEHVTTLAEFWEVDVTCYDPGVDGLDRLPAIRFDAVVCTDVLEHCPEDDLPWIIDELFAYSRTLVYGSVACYPAKKRLPSGENAHCTVRPPSWWHPIIESLARRHPDVRYVFALERRDRTWTGRRRLTRQIIEGGPARGANSNLHRH